MSITRKALASALFHPMKIAPKGSQIESTALSKSQRLLLDYGYVHAGATGQFQFLPLGLRVLDKLIALIDQEMHMIKAQKVVMPTMTSSALWKKSGRFEKLGHDMFTLNDRLDKQLCLGPTFEEVMTNLVASIPKQSHKSFPLKLYQITRKYRDELKPRFGLLRAREFYMKDLYTFDTNLNEAKKTYELVCEAYENIFKKLQVDRYVKVSGDTGIMGGVSSHEFQILADVGEDVIKICPNCRSGINSELDAEEKQCANCKVDYKHHKGIEIGHTFILGDKYSKLFQAQFIDDKAKPRYLQMGCYGIGVSRLMAAVAEVMSTDEFIKWPTAIAPFLFCIIPPKKGSKEESATSMADHLYHHISSSYGKGGVIYDDRTHLTIGQRVMYATMLGYPYIIVCAKGAIQSIPQIEFIDVYNAKKQMLTHSELINKVASII